MQKYGWFGYLGVVSIGAVLAALVCFEADRNRETARRHFIAESHSHSMWVARNVERALRTIYDNVRTITFLPSVRRIDQHGENLNANDRQVIQQIYNNLATQVEVSEVYITTAGFNPDRIDPITKKHDEPAIMFDELIIDGGRFREADDPFTAAAGAGPFEIEIPEVEIYEYRELVEQMRWLKNRYPTNRHIPGFSVPMVGSEELITCDNVDFLATGNDKDRSGVIFSVPFYGDDGKFRGIVSAIILSNAIRQILPAEKFALLNAGYDYISRPSEEGQERRSYAWVAAGEPDPSLVYSEVLPIKSGDVRSPWSLWVGLPNADWLGRVDVAAARQTEVFGYIFVAALVVGGLVCWALILRHVNLVQAVSRTLERRVEERTNEIAAMATHDSMTGLANRRRCEEMLWGGISQADESGGCAVVLHLDLDGFKMVNDTLGHSAGDEVLCEVAQRLRSIVRDGNTPARVGGDEFVVVCPDCDRSFDAVPMAKSILDAFARPFQLTNGVRVDVGCTIGISRYPDDAENAEGLLVAADLALYRAKEAGKNRYLKFDPSMREEFQHKVELARRAREAIDNGEFEVFYQPQIDIESGRVVGVEALARWRDPEFGLRSPGQFIESLEHSGGMHKLGMFVADRAIADAARWQSEGIAFGRVALNVAAAQLSDPEFIDALLGQMIKHGLPPEHLAIEVLEGALISSHNRRLTLLLDELNDLRISVEFDDFGTGYASLNHLRQLPVNRVKIDSSFTAEICSDADHRNIVRGVIHIVHQLGLEVVAEGVETVEQATLLKSWGCCCAQGYLFSRPMPFSEARQYLRLDDHQRSLSAIAGRGSLADPGSSDAEGLLPGSGMKGATI